MTDLEKLIRDRQDELRGRPRDWIDDVMDWHHADWLTAIAIAILSLPLVAVTIWVMVQE